MTLGILEHVNFTVADAKKTAEMLCEIFGWKIRWHGESIGNGTSYHVGNDNDYLAIYTPKDAPSDGENNYAHKGGLNHLGILVEDLDAIEKRVLDYGYKTHSHQEYEPGKRFYFHDENNVEYEIVSYR